MAKEQGAMKRIILTIVALCMASLVQAGEADKFCADPQAWAHFDSLVANSPNDVPLQILHALKIGLCIKIEQGSITTSEAIHLFNDMVDTAANQRGEEDGKKQDF